MSLRQGTTWYSVFRIRITGCVEVVVVEAATRGWNIAPAILCMPVSTQRSPEFTGAMANNEPVCRRCGEEFSRARFLLGFVVCLDCGEEDARKKVHTVVPMHKSNLVVIGPNEREMLKGISNKGGQISGGGQNFASPTEPAGRRNCEVYDGEARLWYKGLTRAETLRLMREFSDRITRASSTRRSAFVPTRRIYVIEGGGQTTPPMRQPWHKRSEPTKK